MAIQSAVSCCFLVFYGFLNHEIHSGGNNTCVYPPTCHPNWFRDASKSKFDKKDTSNSGEKLHGVTSIWGITYRSVTLSEYGCQANSLTVNIFKVTAVMHNWKTQFEYLQSGNHQRLAAIATETQAWWALLTSAGMMMSLRLLEMFDLRPLTCSS